MDCVHLCFYTQDHWLFSINGVNTRTYIYVLTRTLVHTEIPLSLNATDAINLAMLYGLTSINILIILFSRLLFLRSSTLSQAVLDWLRFWMKHFETLKVAWEVYSSPRSFDTA